MNNNKRNKGHDADDPNIGRNIPFGKKLFLPMQDGLVKIIGISLEQFLLLGLIICLYGLFVSWAGRSAGGELGTILIFGLIGAPLAAYGEKIRRILANVRYRTGKLQKTGDGGEDCWSVIVRKDWISFWARPLAHIAKPFLFFEVTIDCAGHSAGSVRAGTRPARVIGQHEKFIVPIGHIDKAPTSDAGLLLIAIRTQANGISVNYGNRIDTILYEDLKPWQQASISEQDFYTLVGLEILNRDGLDMS